ncbi:MAG: helix-turn-helix transcriptional regulator [Burkholderiaceae bacterium]|nr:helix-turn-helix transcriptional regulator [Burkholderiaceae bacterium]
MDQDHSNVPQGLAGLADRPGDLDQPPQAGGGRPRPQNDLLHGGAAEAMLSAGCLTAVLDTLDLGVLVCDGLGRLLLANDAGRRELAQGGVLGLSTEGQLDLPGGGALLLRSAVQQAALGGRRQLLPLRRGECLLIVAVQPLAVLAGGPSRVVLLLGRRQLAPALLVEMLSGLYELTLAEKTVLQGLLSGRRIGQLARERQVKVSTVRTQVATLRAKFGVRRIDDLTRLVAELPPMAGALRTTLRC